MAHRKHAGPSRPLRPIHVIHTLTAACLLAACTSAPQERTASPAATVPAIETTAATATATPLAPILDPAYGPRVEAKEGPYRFRIPAAYFRNQAGPYFDGSWDVHVRWPALGPVPLHKWRDLSIDEQATLVHVGYSYIDKVDIDTLLERYTTPDGDSPEARDDPTQSLRLRSRSGPVHGLWRFSVDYAAHKRFVDTYHKGSPAMLEPRNRDDWYVAYRPDGGIRTLIICDSLEIPEQYAIEGGGVRHLGGIPIPSCRHYFTLPERRIEVDLDYKRVFLRDWALFERRAVELMDAFLVKD